MDNASNSNRKVIVIGASMGGLLAARALSNHFDQVAIMEKDIFPPEGENRKGVPQGKHTHVLLERGRRIMESYLPGLTDELIRYGAADIRDASRSVAWFHTGFHKSGKSDIRGIGVTRPRLEACVRAKVLSSANIQVIEDCKVLNLLTRNDNRRVIGVHLRYPQNSDQDEEMKADLVVDASGRGSHSPVWLEEMGYDRPEDEEVRIGIGYTTCFYRREPDHLPGLNGLVFFATPERKRMGIILGQDGNRWVVTMGGYLGNHAPSEYSGFLKFASELPAPHIYDVIKEAERLTDPVTYNFSANLRRHYEKLNRFPEGYLVLGDAMCSFNPIYGQGMTVAAMEAKALDECLSDGNENLSKRFFNKAGKIIDLPWSSTVGNDLSFPEVQGHRDMMTRLLNWYIDKLHVAARKDAEVSIAFLKVINMMAAPPSILHPRIIWRIIKNNLNRDNYDVSKNDPVNRMDTVEEEIENK